MSTPVNQNSIGICSSCNLGTLWITAIDFQKHDDERYTLDRVYTCDICKLQLRIKAERSDE